MNCTVTLRGTNCPHKNRRKSSRLGVMDMSCRLDRLPEDGCLQLIMYRWATDPNKLEQRASIYRILIVSIRRGA